MKHFVDGDQVVITLDDFIDLQQSPAEFIPVDSEDGQSVIAGGVLQLPFGRFHDIYARLKHKRATTRRKAVSSITSQKLSLREEIVDCMKVVIFNSSEEEHLSVTLGLTRSLARKMTLSELTNWRDQVVAEMIEE